MLRYEVIAHTVLTINLHNGYSILAMAKWNNNDNCYYANFYIKENTIEHLDLIDDSEYMQVKFESDRKDINHAIFVYISNLNDKNVFEKYIERYEYELDCFTRGNEDK